MGNVGRSKWAFQFPLKSKLDVLESAPITLHYTGDDVDGEMNARAVAAALDGMADLVDVAVSKGALPQGSRVKVKAYESGSFVIVTAIEWMTANAAGIAGALSAAAGFVKLVNDAIAFHNRRDIVDFGPGSEPGLIRVVLRGGSAFEVTREVWDVVSHKRARKALGKMYAPLGADPGVAAMEMSAGGERASLTAVEAVQLEQEGEAEDVLTETLETVRVTPASVSFEDDGKWTVYQGKKRFRVTIEDSRFLQDVADGRARVGKYDIFTVALRIEHLKRVNGSTTTSYYIERVINHEAGVEQDELPGEGEQG